MLSELTRSRLSTLLLRARGGVRRKGISRSRGSQEEMLRASCSAVGPGVASDFVKQPRPPHHVAIYIDSGASLSP